jgi:hypothetical protein
VLVPTGLLLALPNLSLVERLHAAPRLVVELLVGPGKTLALDLFGAGRPAEELPDPMAGSTLVVYLVCLATSFAHPARPGRSMAAISLAAFGVWYAWAVFAVIAYVLSQL